MHAERKKNNNTKKKADWERVRRKKFSCEKLFGKLTFQWPITTQLTNLKVLRGRPIVPTARYFPKPPVDTVPQPYYGSGMTHFTYL